MPTLLLLLLSYLLGSLPTSLIAGRVLRGIDIREHGSGNAGGTNTFRVLGIGPGIVVSVVDVAKGFAAAAFVAQLRLGPVPFDGVTVQLLAGAAAVVGHVYPVWAGFRGGKGVATGGGLLLAVAPMAAACGIVVFAAVVGLTRYVSVASMTAALSVPLFLAFERFVLGDAVPNVLLAVACALPVFIVYTHRSNLARLRQGSENQMGRRTSAGPTDGQ